MAMVATVTNSNAKNDVPVVEKLVAEVELDKKLNHLKVRFPSSTEPGRKFILTCESLTKLGDIWHGVFLQPETALDTTLPLITLEDGRLVIPRSIKMPDLLGGGFCTVSLVNSVNTTFGIPVVIQDAILVLE